MARVSVFPLGRGAVRFIPRRVAQSKDLVDLVDTIVFGEPPIYRGAQPRSERYVGSRPDNELYFGKKPVWE